MKSTTVRRMTLSIAVVTALTGVAACGSSGGSGKAAKAVGRTRPCPMTADGALSWGDGLRGDLTITYTGGKMAGAMRRLGSTQMQGRYQLAGLKKQLGQAGVTTETVGIWVDDQDLLVKKVEKADMTAGAMTSTAYYSDYGTKVTAVAPPAGDTKDFKDLMRAGGTAGGGTGVSS